MKRRVTTGGKGTKGPRRKAAKTGSAPPTTRRHRSADIGLQDQLDEARRELREAREQQTATSEVLKVISSSPGRLEPVFQAMLANAVRLCESKFGLMYLHENGGYRLATVHNTPPALTEYQRGRGWFQARAEGPLGRMLQAKDVVQADDDVTASTAAARLGGARSYIAVPMLKDGTLVGVICIYRQEVRPFTDKQIELVQNFAAQAVIAIENTRLLNELRQRTDDLSESLEQQTATSEVLQVISSSPGRLEPVFNVMLQNALRICDARFGVMFRIDGGVLFPVATLNLPPALDDFIRQRGPTRPIPGADLDRLVGSKQMVHTLDMLESPVVAPSARLAGGRTQLAVPMLKDADLIGAIVIYRQEVRPFTDKQIELVCSFAAQAVIAIENTRLLNELRQRTDDLTESLEQQTATSKVLQVISSSPGELEPVFQAMLENATKLCEATFGTMMRFDGELFHPVAELNQPAPLSEFLRDRGPFRAQPGSSLEQLIQTKSVVNVEDEGAQPYGGSPARLGGARSSLRVPMLKDGNLVGAILIYRQEVRPFTNKQIELVQNFAAQAVIAIENTRLLNELRDSLERQTATGEILGSISGSITDAQPVFDAIARNLRRLFDTRLAAVLVLKDSMVHLAAAGDPGEFERLSKVWPQALDETSGAGRSMLAKQVVQFAPVQSNPSVPVTTQRFGKELGFDAAIFAPMIRGNTVIGAIATARPGPQPFDDKQIALIKSFAAQAVIAVENARLFDEIQDKSRQLAEASQHKSQFLASMSHELRTPLNAILGYNELIVDGIYGAPPERMLAVLKRVESNGRHLLGLINAVLDLSKIEAGQLTLDLADYSLQNVAQTVYNAVEPLAADKKLSFKADVQPDLPPGRGDERRLTQVLLNLVGNAIKFTDAGEVVIKAGASNGDFHLSVRDTGPGISAADQAKLFQEFQQAENPNTRKKEGTGLGLAISKRIVEMHGGRIWMESQLGRGSTFFVTLPVQVQEQAKNPSVSPGT